MNKSKTISLFLAFIIISGTITAFFPSSSFITEIHALEDYGLDNNYKKSNDISKSISKNKIKCINDNININGENAGDVNIGNKGKVAPTAAAEEGYLGAYSSGSGVYGKGYDNKKDKDIDCIINNDNENRQITQQPITQLPPSPPPPPPIDTEILTVIKNVACQADTATCEQNPIVPSQFNIIVEGNNPSDTNFPGSSTGTEVELEPGQYSVTEQGLDPVTPQICSSFEFKAGRDASEIGANLFICTNFSEECEGDISIDDPQTCTIENVLVQAIVGATLSINKDWFVCNNDAIDCTIEIPGQQISFQGPNSGMYSQCTSDMDCPFANDAGFNIEITGNSPTPNTIPAQINTMQDVDIGAGSFEVAEELFSNEFVTNANVEVENVPVGQDINDNSRLIIMVDEAGERVFTANEGSDSVSIIDLNNANTVTNVPLAPSGGDRPFAIAVDEAGERVFTANFDSHSISIIDLANANTVTNVPLAPSGGFSPAAITFDEAGQRVFTSNSGSLSIIDLNNANTVTTVSLSGGGGRGIAFDETGQRVFTGGFGSGGLVSIIDLNNANTVTNVPLAPSGGGIPNGIAFDETGQRVFTVSQSSDSVSIVELNNANTVTNVPLNPSGGIQPQAIAFDEIGERVLVSNSDSNSVSIIDLNNANTVTNVSLLPGGVAPIGITFDEAGQRVFTANSGGFSSMSIIDLANANTVTNVPLAPSGAIRSFAIAFDQTGQRVFTANAISDSVSIIEFPTINRICQDSGFDTGDIRTFESNGQTIQQITCVNFVGECSGEIDNGETRECTVEDYVVAVNDVSNGGIGILANIDKPLQQLVTNDISTTKDITAIKNIVQEKLQQKQIEQQNIQTNNIIQPKDITTKDIAIKNIIEQKEQKQIEVEQKILTDNNNMMSPPSLP